MYQKVRKRHEYANETIIKRAIFSKKLYLQKDLQIEKYMYILAVNVLTAAEFTHASLIQLRAARLQLGSKNRIDLCVAETRG